MNTVKLQIFVRYLCSYFRLETGSYVLIFVLSRVCEENDVEIQWLQSKNKFHTILNFVLFQKYEMYENKYRTKICDFTVTPFPSRTCQPSRSARSCLYSKPWASWVGLTDELETSESLCIVCAPKKKKKKAMFTNHPSALNTLIEKYTQANTNRPPPHPLNLLHFRMCLRPRVDL